MMRNLFVFLLIFILISLFSSVSGATLRERRLANLRLLYNNTIFPNMIELIYSGGNAATYFHPNVSGRINGLGDFLGRQNTVEYFYALANPLDYELTNGTSRLVQVDIRILDLVDNRASVQVNMGLAVYPSFVVNRNLTHTGWFAFLPDTDLIIGYDLTIIRLGQLVDPPVSYRPQYILTLCTQIQARCTGPNEQYDNVTDCVNFMNSIEFGSYYNAWSDTVSCRHLHNYLTRVRPEYHCAHSGPTGGEKCVYHSYESWYNVEYVVNIGHDSFNSNDCVPSCPVSVKSIPVNSWTSEGNFYQQYQLEATNNGSTSAVNVRVRIAFNGNSYIHSSYNISPPTSNAGESYKDVTCPLYNLAPGQTSRPCGYTVVSPSFLSLSEDSYITYLQAVCP